MNIPKVHDGEYRLCKAVWANEPVSAVNLAKICLEQFNWQRTTTYTVIKRLCQKGILSNANGIITSAVSMEEIQNSEIDSLIERNFDGSVPKFLAAFTKKENISEEELNELQGMIDRIRKGEN